MKRTICILLACAICAGCCACAADKSASAEEIFGKLNKYLPANVMENLPDFLENETDGRITYLWSKWDEPQNMYTHAVEMSFTDGNLNFYHYKSYLFTEELIENNITMDVAYDLVKSFAKDFIRDGGKLEFENKPANKSLYDPGKVESWVYECDGEYYTVMVNLVYGYVEYFSIAGQKWNGEY